MRITRAADWVLFSTSRFDEQVAYVRDVLGMPIESRGPAVVDQHLLRYVLFALPGGVTLEVVEPSPEFALSMTSRSSASRSTTFPKDSVSWRQGSRRRYHRCSPTGVAGVGPICGCQMAASTSFKAGSHSS
jgi:hypothetical protein